MRFKRQRNERTNERTNERVNRRKSPSRKATVRRGLYDCACVASYKALTITCSVAAEICAEISILRWHWDTASWHRTSKAPCTLATKLNSTRSTLLYRFSPVYTGDKIDCIGDSRLCCRFVASFGNSQLCRQCVPGLRARTVNFCQRLSVVHV